MELQHPGKHGLYDGQRDPPPKRVFVQTQPALGVQAANRAKEERERQRERALGRLLRRPTAEQTLSGRDQSETPEPGRRLPRYDRDESEDDPTDRRSQGQLTVNGRKSRRDDATLSSQQVETLRHLKGAILATVLFDNAYLTSTDDVEKALKQTWDEQAKELNLNAEWTNEVAYRVLLRSVAPVFPY